MRSLLDSLETLRVGGPYETSKPDSVVSSDNPFSSFIAPCLFLIITRYVPVAAATVNAGQPSAPTDGDRSSAEIVKVDVDLVTIDALVLQKNTARIVGGLKKEDFILYEDGAKQNITSFQSGQPAAFRAALDRSRWLSGSFRRGGTSRSQDAIARLKPADEVAVMTYHDTTQLLQGFTRDRALIEDALNRSRPTTSRRIIV